MARLQELLTQSVQQSLGLGDILSTRRREAEQLGQTLQQAELIKSQREQEREQADIRGIQQIGQAATQFRAGQLQQEAARVAGEEKAFERGLKLEELGIKKAELGEKKLIRKAKGQETFANLLKEGFIKTSPDDPKAEKFEIAGRETFLKFEPKGRFKFEEKLGILNEETGEIVLGVQQLGLPTVDTEKQFDQEKKIRDEFTKKSKDFVDLRDAFEKIKRSAESPSAAGDLAMIFNYMKILDPGSTVREGEFANAQNSAGVPQRIRAQFNNWEKGQRLSDVQRKDFLNRSKSLFGGQQKIQKKTRIQHEKLAKQYGLNPERAVLKFDILDKIGFTSSTGKQFVLPNKGG